MKYNRRNKGFTIIELLSVVAILSIISTVLLWFNKGAYQHGRGTLTKEYVQNLNKYVELYQLHLTESNSSNQVFWQTKEEALEAMHRKIPNTDIIVLKKLPGAKGVLESILWNKESLQFEVKTKNTI